MPKLVDVVSFVSKIKNKVFLFFSNISRRTFIIISIVFLSSVGVLTYVGYNQNWSAFRHTSTIPASTPRPSPRPIPHGKIGFTVGQSDKTVPLFGRGFVDPYDPVKGATQTVTIAVKYTEPVTGVTAVLKTDNAVSTPVPFTLTSGTNTDGQWQGSWKVTDTYLYTYALVFNAESQNKSGSVEVTLR